MMSEDDNTSKKSAEPSAPDVDGELVNIVEAAIFAADKPVGVRALIALFPKSAAPTRIDIQNAVTQLQARYVDRGVELRRIGRGWRFQSREKYSDWLRKLNQGRSPRYSRALMETLAIIAYRQPVTRGDIEEIRGVSVSSDTIRILMEREWIKTVGHRDVPGRPTLFATSDEFLRYFNLTSLRDLPEMVDPRELGDIARDMNLSLPIDGLETDAEQAEAEAATGDDDHIAEVIPLHPDSDTADDAAPAHPENDGGDTDQPDGGEDP